MSEMITLIECKPLYFFDVTTTANVAYFSNQHQTRTRPTVLREMYSTVASAGARPSQS